MTLQVNTIKATVYTKHIIADFGAVGNGTANDEDAFVKAALWFNNIEIIPGSSGSPGTPVSVTHVDYQNGDQGILIIDYLQADHVTQAVYKVGTQYNPGDFIRSSESGGPVTNPSWTDLPGGSNSGCYLKRGNDIFTIAPYVDGLTIKTDGPVDAKVKIKYANDLYYGAWCPKNYYFKCYKTKCALGSCYTPTPGHGDYVPKLNETDDYSFGCASCTAGSTDCKCSTLSSGAFNGMVEPEHFSAGDLNNTTGDIKPLPEACNVGGIYYDWKTQCAVGNFFYVKGKNVTIQDIDLDGNNKNCRFGRWSNDAGGIQLAYSGIIVGIYNDPNASDPTPIDLDAQITNVSAHNFGLDGFTVVGVANKVTLTNCFFEENVRQAFTWGGGYHINATNVHCNKTGNVINVNPLSVITDPLSPNNLMFGNPGGGIDIEQHGLPCEHGTFTHCEFSENQGQALTNDNFNPAIPIGDVTFNYCDFNDITADGITVTGYGFTFNHCNINALANVGYKYLNPSDGTLFYDCNFEDKPINGVSNSSHNYLVISGSSNNLRFIDCDFIINDEKRAMFKIDAPPATWPKLQWPLFDHCTMTYKNLTNGSSTILNQVRFKRKNTFKNMYSNSAYDPECTTHRIDLSDVWIVGDNQECNNSSPEDESKLIMDGYLHCWVDKKLEIGKQDNGTDDGYAKLEFKNHAILQGMWDFSLPLPEPYFDQLIIGEKSRVIFNPTTRFLTSHVDLKGSLILHDNTTMQLNGGSPLPTSQYKKSINASANSLLFISPQCNLYDLVAGPYAYQTGGCSNWAGSTSAYYTSGSLTNSSEPFWGIFSGNCIQGKNHFVDAVPGLTCSPTYSNISTNGSYSVMYNLHNATCNGANNGSIDINIIGGTSAYSYSINPGGTNIPLSNSIATISGLSQGLYTITISDGSSCTNSFEIQINEPPLVTITASSTNVTCNGAGDGTISYTASIGATVTINGFPPASSYGPGTYTVTASAASGTGVGSCTASTTVTISEPIPVTITASSTNVTCNGAGNGTISYTASIGATVTINGFPPASSYGPGTYTVTASAASGTGVGSCTASTTVSISEPIPVTITASSTNVTCNGAGNGTISYTASIGATVTINGFPPASSYGPGTYTVTASAASGTGVGSCTASTTVTISQPLALTWNSTSYNNVTCSSAPFNNDGSIAVSTNNGGTLPISYTIQPIVSSASQPTAGHFIGLTAGQYTIQASDANSCSISTSIIIGQPTPNQCSCNNGADLIANTPNLIVLNNPTASYILNNYSPLSSTLSARTLYIDGILTVDVDFSVDQCILYFAPNSSVLLNVGADFNVLNVSILQASCDWWGGIVAFDAGNKVAVKNKSVIKNSSSGIHLSNNAIIEAEISSFIDNGSEDIKLANMTLNPYPGYIKGNTFFTQTNLPGPWNRTQTAIVLYNVRQLTIGDIADPSNGNEFSNMRTGINIENTIVHGNNSINIYNNSFDNIHGDLNPGTFNDANIVTNCYTSEGGAAVFSDFSGYPIFSGYVDVSNSVGSNANIINCDKAIALTGNALNASNLFTENCLLGIMCSSPYERGYRIKHNTLVNTYIGIELFGSQESAQIEQNEITTNYGIHTSSINMKAPIGIKVQYSPWNATYKTMKFSILSNKVDVRSVAGIGIMNSYGKLDMFTGSNEVKFTNNSTINIASAGFNIRSLFGYYNDACDGSTFEDNSTKGHTNQLVWKARDSKGMYFSQGPNCRISCNKAKYTRYGFYVFGSNETDPDKVTFNKFDANAFPWFFLDGPSATKGSFGNVGDPASPTPNNGNEFVYNVGGTGIDWRLVGGINPDNYKVYRYSGQPFTAIILTESSILKQIECGSYNSPSADYQVQDPGMSYDDPCPEEVIFNPIIDTVIVDNGDYIDDELAIVNDSVDYINFPIVGGWIDKKRLYERLDADSVLRYSNWDLLTFYNNYHNTVIGSIKNADLALSLLSDSGMNDAEFIARYNAAILANQDIISSDDWEINEQTINNLNMKVIRQGIDSITIPEKEIIYNLANSCPFIEGTSVYKARVLWSNFMPGEVFDDRIICITSQNKNDEGSNQDIDSLYLTQIKNSTSSSIKHVIDTNTSLIKNSSESEVKIFPNPANTEIFIEYNCDAFGKFILFNSLGQEVLTSELTAGNKKVIISSMSLTAGVYSYRLLVEGCINKAGKLTILK